MDMRHINTFAVIFNGRGDLLLEEDRMPNDVVGAAETVEAATVRMVQEATQAIWPAGFELRLLRLYSLPERLYITFLGVAQETVLIRRPGVGWVHDWEKVIHPDQREMAKEGWKATGLQRGPLPSPPTPPAERGLEEGAPQVNLTASQRQYLKRLYTGLGADAKVSNPTLMGLAKKGLVRYQMMHAAGGGRPHWTITEAGRAAISS